MRKISFVILVAMTFSFILGGLLLKRVPIGASGSSLGFKVVDMAQESVLPAGSSETTLPHIINLPANAESPGLLALVAGSGESSTSLTQQFTAALARKASGKHLGLPEPPRLDLPAHVFQLATLMPPVLHKRPDAAVKRLKTSTLDKLAQAQSLAAQLQQESLEAEITYESETAARITDREVTKQAELQKLLSETRRYRLLRAAEGQALAKQLVAQGERALRQAQALKMRLTAEALSRPGGEFVGPLRAIEHFKLGETQLDSSVSDFYYRFGSMPSWRAFFEVGP